MFMLTHTRLRKGEKLSVVARDVKSLPSRAAIETKVQSNVEAIIKIRSCRTYWLKQC